MRQSFGSALGHGVLSVGLVALIGLVGSVVLARLYGVVVIGEYALTLAPVTVMTYLTTVQEQAALMKELSTLPARAPRVTGLFAAVFSFSFGLTVAVGAVVAAVATWVLRGPVGSPDLVAPMLMQIASYIVVQNTCWNVDSVLNAFRAGKALLWVRLTQAVAFLAIAVGFGLHYDEPSVWGLAAANAGSWTVSLLPRLKALRTVMRIRVPWREVRRGFGELPAIIRFGVRAAPGGILVGANAEAGVWILGVTSTKVDVGAWSRARMLGDRVREFTIRVNEVLLPTLVEREAQGDLAGRDRALVDSWRLSLAGMLLPAACVGGAAVGVMNVFGPGFSQGATALALVMLYQAQQAVDSLHVTALYARNRPTLTTVAAAVSVLVGVTLAVVLAGPLGATGPAIGLVLGMLASTAVMHATVRRGLSQPLHRLWGPRAMLAQIGAYGAGFAAAYAVDDRLDGHLGTLVALAAGFVAYVVPFLALGGLEERDRERMARLRSRFGRGAAPAEPPPAQAGWPPPPARGLPAPAGNGNGVGPHTPVSPPWPPAPAAPVGATRPALVLPPLVAPTDAPIAAPAVAAAGLGVPVPAASARRDPRSVPFQAVVTIDDARPVAVEAVGGVDHIASAMTALHIADPDARVPLLVRADAALNAGTVWELAIERRLQGGPGVVVLGESAVSSRPAEALAAAATLRRAGWAVGLGDLGGSRRASGLIALLEPQLLVVDMAVTRAMGAAAAAGSLAAVAAERERTGAPLIARGIETHVQLAAAVGLGATHAQGPLFGSPGPLMPEMIAGVAPLVPPPAPPASPAGMTPFEIVAAQRPVQTGVAHRLEGVATAIAEQAAQTEGEGLLLTCVGEASRLDADTLGRHVRAAAHMPTVALFGVALPPQPAEGLSRVPLDPADPLRAQWVVLTLGPDVAAAMVALDMGDGGAPENRRYWYAVTHDRALVGACARALLARIADPAAGVPMPGEV